MSQNYAAWLLQMPEAPEGWDVNGDGAHYLRAILDPRNQNCKEEWSLTINYVRARLLGRYEAYPLLRFLESLPQYYEQHCVKPALLKRALVAKKWL